MKAFGYLCAFLFLCFGARLLAISAASNNVELGVFLGILIPVVIAVLALANGDFD